MITGHLYFKDSFGRLQTVLTGGSIWTMRLLRGTKIALPHIAKNDTFTYICQFNHDKTLLNNADDFHIHYIPIGAVAGGEFINLNYAWGWYKFGDVFPATLPNTGAVRIPLVAGDQYKLKLAELLTNLAFPPGETYSSELFVEFTRTNDGNDTYAGEFALLDGDSHYPTNRLGSYNDVRD